MELKDGQTLPAELFLVCTGVRANVDLARAAELEVGRGVVVDDRMRTSDPAIFAAGDVAEFEGGSGACGRWRSSRAASLR